MGEGGTEGVDGGGEGAHTSFTCPKSHSTLMQL